MTRSACASASVKRSGAGAAARVEMAMDESRESDLRGSAAVVVGDCDGETAPTLFAAARNPANKSSSDVRVPNAPSSLERGAPEDAIGRGSAGVWAEDSPSLTHLLTLFRRLRARLCKVE